MPPLYKIVPFLGGKTGQILLPAGGNQLLRDFGGDNVDAQGKTIVQERISVADFHGIKVAAWSHLIPPAPVKIAGRGSPNISPGLLAKYPEQYRNKHA
jgi:hypothetical protein